MSELRRAAQAVIDEEDKYGMVGMEKVCDLRAALRAPDITADLTDSQVKVIENAGGVKAIMDILMRFRNTDAEVWRPASIELATLNIAWLEATDGEIE